MYNAEIPPRSELPSTSQLIKSTIIAILTAIIVLVAVVLPAEHAVDPTGIGRVLKLTDMGQIKRQLAREAEADRQRATSEEPQKKSDVRTLNLEFLLASLLIGNAYAAGPVIAQAQSRTDETVVKLKPGEGQEFKMTMRQGGRVEYSWMASGGVNYDFHGAPPSNGKEMSYKSGRSVTSDKGDFTAKLEGKYGWFFRNRTDSDVTIVLKTSGEYSGIGRVL